MAGAECGPESHLERLGIVRAELIEKIKAWKEPLTENEKAFIRLGKAVCGAAGGAAADPNPHPRPRARPHPSPHPQPEPEPEA